MDCFSKRRKLYLYTANSCTPQRGKNRQIFKWQKSVWLHGSQFAQSGSYFPPVWAPEMDNSVGKSHVKICSLFHCGVITGNESLCQCGKWTHDLAYKQNHFPKESGQNHGAWLDAKKRAGIERSAWWQVIFQSAYSSAVVCCRRRAMGGGQIPVVVHQEPVLVCYVEVLALGASCLAPSDACRNPSTGSAALGSAWLHALPGCKYCSLGLRRGGKAKNKLKSILIPLPLCAIRGTKHPVLASGVSSQVADIRRRAPDFPVTSQLS